MKRTWGILACLLLPLTTLTAQDATTPFRAGQWAAQFGWQATLTSLGVLAFTRPTRAWILDVRLAWRNVDTETTGSFGVGSGEDDFVLTSLRIGRRFYQGRSDRVVTYQSLGVTGSYTRASLVTPSSGTQEVRETTLGGFGELGASYLITRNLSLGLTATVQAGSVATRRESPPDIVSKGSGFQVSALGLVLVASIYF